MELNFIDMSERIGRPTLHAELEINDVQFDAEAYLDRKTPQYVGKIRMQTTHMLPVFAQFFDSLDEAKSYCQEMTAIIEEETASKNMVSTQAHVMEMSKKNGYLAS